MRWGGTTSTTTRRASSFLQRTSARVGSSSFSAVRPERVSTSPLTMDGGGTDYTRVSGSSSADGEFLERRHASPLFIYRILKYDFRNGELRPHKNRKEMA